MADFLERFRDDAEERVEGRKGEGRGTRQGKRNRGVSVSKFSPDGRGESNKKDEDEEALAP